MTDEDKLPPTLSEAAVIFAHDEIIRLTGGIEGDPKPTSVGGALSRIEFRILFEHLRDPIEIASWYGYSIARGHCFADGNKRTGTLCMLTYLRLTETSINLHPLPEELADLMVDIAEDRKSQSDLHEFLVREYSKQNTAE